MEGVGVAFKCSQVAPLFGEHGVLQFLSFPVFEKTADGVLARVAKGWIAQIVSQAHCGNDGLDIGLSVFQFGMLREELLNGPAGDGASYAGHFQAMGQSVVYHLASGQGEHLGLVLQAAESAGEDDAVVIALERASDVGALVR